MRLSNLSLALAVLASPAAAQEGNGPVVEKLQRSLVGVLKDPLTAQIIIRKGPRPDRVTDHGEWREGVGYCTLVNARNSYGGYVGFRPAFFIVYKEGDVGVFMGGRGEPAADFVYGKCGDLLPPGS